jgi:negative regulator of flagellin synthesis FlgM
MKISEWVKGTKPYETDSAKRTKNDKAAKTGDGAGAASESSGADKVRISDRSREIARVRELALASPDIRAEKVAEVKARYDSGDYEVDPDKVADALLRGTIDETV